MFPEYFVEAPTFVRPTERRGVPWSAMGDLVALFRLAACAFWIPGHGFVGGKPFCLETLLACCVRAVDGSAYVAVACSGVGGGFVVGRGGCCHVALAPPLPLS